jgi:hypothetical protein
MALAVVAALLCALPVFPVAPPPKPAVPGPPGLFEVPEFQTDPVRMAMSVIGAGASPTGGWAGAGVLYVGEHPRVNAWKLDGPLTNQYSRIALGASTAVLAGFRGDLFGTSAIVQLATLKAGDHAFCWALRDTDRFHALPKEWLAAFADEKGIPEGGLEAEIYCKVLELANYTSAAAFKRAVRTDITYSHVFNDPDDYRGEVMHVEGKLKRVNRYKPPWDAAQKGVNDVYVGWVFSEYLGSNPYRVIFTEWPADLPRDLLGKESIPGDYKVAMDGYFVKKYRYPARMNSGRGTDRDAPLLIGHSLIYVGRTTAGTGESSAWLNNLVYGIVGVFGSLLAAVVGLTWWFRRTDQRVRRQILAIHSQEFVLPPPDALPVAPPVAPPAQRAAAAGRPLTPRITFPAGKAHRFIEPPSSGEGGKRGSADKPPPDEGAGARPRP